MTWRDWIAALRRRWYVVLGGLLLTGLAIGFSPRIAPPQYAAKGLVVLLPPRTATPLGENPFLDLGGLDLPARVLVAYYSSNSTVDAIKAVSPDADVTVSIEESTRSPVIAVNVLDTSPDGALKTLQYVVSTIPTNLARLQADVQAPVNTRVTTLTLTLDERAEPDLTTLVRVLIAAGVGGLALTILLAVAIDGSVRRRKELRSNPGPGDGSQTARGDGHPQRAETGPVTDTIADDWPSQTEPAPEADSGSARPESSPERRSRRSSRASDHSEGRRPGPSNGSAVETADLNDTLPLNA